MKLSTRSAILKSSSVELIAPLVVECFQSEKAFQKPSVIQGVPIEYAVMNQPLDDGGDQPQEDRNGSRSKLLNNDPALEVLKRAEKEAEAIMASARHKADELLASTQRECDSMRLALEADIRQEISTTAKAEGYERGLKEAAEEAERIRKQARDYLELSQRALMDEFCRVDQDLVHVCLKISERIIRTSIGLNPGSLLNIIRNLELVPKQKPGMKVHISPQDWEWFRNLPTEDRPSLEVIPDQTMRAGDAYLECDEGIFEATISSQLEKLEQFLLEELNNGLDRTGEEN